MRGIIPDAMFSTGPWYVYVVRVPIVGLPPDRSSQASVELLMYQDHPSHILDVRCTISGGAE